MIRRSEDRGLTKLDWLESRHTFSFGSYHDRQHMGFGVLRVINEDRIRPGMGFGTHPHRDMEIITYVIEGALAHEDSMGNGSVISAGEVQRMTAGTGVTHSEYNHSKTDVVHLLQIWILPIRERLEPAYEQRSFARDLAPRLRLIASGDGRDGSVTVHQDVSLYLGVLDAEAEIAHRLAPDRQGWLQMVRGAVACDGETLRAGDGATVSSGTLGLHALEPSELLWFDLP
jgi:hypothetical protein